MLMPWIYAPVTDFIASATVANIFCSCSKDKVIEVGAEGGDPSFDQALGHSVQALNIGIAGILSGAAVDMHIDQTGDNGIAGQIQAFPAVDAGPHAGDLIALTSISARTGLNSSL